MRKKLAALLCAVMCITAFTGCSKAELGYLQMSVDMLNSLEVCEASGKVNVDLDVDAMKEYVADLSKTAGYADEKIQESLKELETLKGKQSVVVDYSLKMNMDTLDYYLDMDMTYGGKKYDMGDMYFGMTDGIYVSGKTVWGMYELTKDIVGADEKSYLLDENFAKELKATLDESKYINLISMAEMGLTEEEMAQIAPNSGFSDLYSSVFEFYKNAFSGFTTNMVSEVSGGYKVQADGKAVAQLVVDLLDYVGNNPDTVLAATTTYMLDVMKATKASEEEIAEFKAQMEAAKADVASVKETTDAVKTMIQQAIETPVVTDVLNSFKYEATITKSGAAYNSKETFGITNGSKSVLKVTSDSVMKAGKDKVVMPTSSVSTTALEEKLVALTEKYNPVTAVSVLWGMEGDSQAMLTKERAEVSLASNDTELTDYVVTEGRVYLPLRVICEAMGETVEWNKEDKTAYVVREGAKTAMEGVLQDGKSFISVRDFEKLGYTVDYKTVDGLKEATVSK
ncbi:copper amine oxidase N-terminal domain-containing protein [Anaerotignum sp.]|uniref:copper amine oxidase N-terminal domain-containing protein n=1 Tax=Anaerotignum sp. TaxID=2039241 RepID=UPI0028B07E78|nr:copper amine oxidase N-terminal domain-containing protein [Anaerotignum sp.]